MTTLLVSIPSDVTPDDRLSIKDAIGDAVRNTLDRDLSVSIDHLGLPVDVSQQED